MKKQIISAAIGLIIVSLTVITLAFSTTIGLIIYESFFKIPEEVTVPSLTSKRVADAVLYLKKLNLNPKVKEDFREGIPAGEIISQSPKAGESVRSGRDIRIVASLGAELISVPDITGMSLLEGEQVLRQNRFTIGKITFNEGENSTEEITSQSPKGHTRVRRGTPVDLKVNKGAIVKYEVPIWQGKTLDEVKDIAKDSPFEIGRLRWVYDEHTPAGTIIKQNPAPSQYSAQLRPINLDISAGDRTSDLFIKQETFTFIVPDGESRTEVKAILKDNRGTNTIYTSDHMPGDRVQITVTTYGPGELSIFSDNKQRAKVII